MADTRRRILDAARGLFNDQGLHRVGVRDIARAVGVSPGNLGYHFATKDALVVALVRELHDVNARAVFADLPADFSLRTLYATAAAAMGHMLAYRFLLLSYFDAVSGSAALRRVERELWAERRRRFDVMLQRLCANGFVDRRAVAPHVAALYELGQIVSSSWLLTEALRDRPRRDRAAILHYAKLGCGLLEPYCTATGQRQMRQIQRGAYDDTIVLP